MINYHPSQRQLTQFVSGDLSPAWSLMVSAHVDMCPYCQNEVSLITARLAGENIEVSGSEALDPLLANMLNDITELEAPIIEAPVNHCDHLELDGRKFELPRALQRFVSKTDEWSRLVGKLWQAPVDLGSAGKAHFIYMESGGSVPEHTHKGNELTLVINGEFEDGHRSYDTGDFILQNSSNTHEPVSHDRDGCLVFSFVDQPLYFTTGIARLLNPFSHLFFR